MNNVKRFYVLKYHNNIYISTLKCVNLIYFRLLSSSILTVLIYYTPSLVHEEGHLSVSIYYYLTLCFVLIINEVSASFPLLTCIIKYYFIKQFINEQFQVLTLLYNKNNSFKRISYTIV